MAEIPIIIPLLLLGVLIGSIVRTTRARITGRFIVLGSLLGGLGNLVYAVALNLIQNKSATEDVARPFASTQTILNNSSVSFLVFCFIAGSLIVLIVFVSAALTLKIRGRTVLEE